MRILCSGVDCFCYYQSQSPADSAFRDQNNQTPVKAVIALKATFVRRILNTSS